MKVGSMVYHIKSTDEKEWIDLCELANQLEAQIFMYQQCTSNSTAVVSLCDLGKENTRNMILLVWDHSCHEVKTLS